MKSRSRGINSPYFIGDFLLYFLKKNKNKINFKIFFKKTGINPAKFNSPLYLAGLSSEKQYHAVRRYLGKDKADFLRIIIEHDQKCHLIVPAMRRREEMLRKL